MLSKIFCWVLLIGFTVNAQTTISLSGKVTNKSGTAISNAIVTLVGQGLKDTTGSDGAYTITKSNVSVLQPLVPQTEEIWLSNGFLEFSLTNPSPIKIAIFDVKGNLLKKEVSKNASTGFYRFNISENSRATNLLVIKASIGQRQMTFRYMPFSSGKYAVNSSGQYATTSTPVSSGLAQVAAISDTLKVTATGFTAKVTAITSYSQTVNITLDSSNSVSSSDTGRSAGCTKTSSLKSGTYTITSAGLSRQYIISIPSNYDKTHPYRLIFGMHCYGSSMQGVASDSFYQLKRYADSTKNYCIFVAPNGYGSGTPLWNQGEKDHTFFDDMLKIFKDSLCVDTTRVFSCGFSYGAMFTYSLSTNHQKQLRAVACYAPANWNIYLPINTHEPIAYMQTTGINDTTCKWIYSDADSQGGKYCVSGHAKDNGCTIPVTIPTTTSGSKTHICYEFLGCQDKYPVKFYSFDGSHQCAPVDGTSGTDNSKKSWIPAETWKFFTQF
jgi:poly(3-hydroxybutyrate) depolymerase